MDNKANSKPMGRPTKWTPDTEDKIVEWIRRGAYDWVAAQAAGIDRHTFINWMKREDEPFVAFQDRVRQARAQARAEVEVLVRQDSPFNWLRYGPGRERPGEPGWTDSTSLTGYDGGELVIRVEYMDKPASYEEKEKTPE